MRKSKANIGKKYFLCAQNKLKYWHDQGNSSSGAEEAGVDEAGSYAGKIS